MKSCDDVETQYGNTRNCIMKASQQIKPLKSKTNKLTTDTQNLIIERQKLARYTPQYREMDIKVKRTIRKDIRNYNMNLVKTALDKNRSLKSAMQGIGKTCNNMLERRSGKIGIKFSKFAHNIYKNLYSNDTSPQSMGIEEYVYSDKISPITGLETHRAIVSLKYNRSPGDDGITAEALKAGEQVLLPHRKAISQVCLNKTC
ncbi:putative exo endo phos, partial [Operophtera brumata]